MEPVDVAIVDDEEIDRYLAHRVLRRFPTIGAITEYRDGADFLDHVRAEDRGAEVLPLLVLLDINMPRQSGFEVIEELSQNRSEVTDPALVVLILTSSGWAQDLQTAATAPCVFDYLQKPITPEVLGPILGRCLPISR
ncbi:MAG: response regulator [Actinomycetia bacterium]|nr:response regulator [Actinomycetes bacterium]